MAVVRRTPRRVAVSLLSQGSHPLAFPALASRDGAPHSLVGWAARPKEV